MDYNTTVRQQRCSGCKRAASQRQMRMWGLLWILQCGCALAGAIFGVVLLVSRFGLTGAEAAEFAEENAMGLVDDVNGMMETQRHTKGFSSEKKYSQTTWRVDGEDWMGRIEQMTRILTDDQSALFEAIQQGSLDDVRALLHGMNRNDINVLKKPGQCSVASLLACAPMRNKEREIMGRKRAITDLSE